MLLIEKSWWWDGRGLCRVSQTSFDDWDWWIGDDGLQVGLVSCPLVNYFQQISSGGASDLTLRRFNDGVNFVRILWLSSIFSEPLFWREEFGLMRPQRRSLQSDQKLQCELSLAWEVLAIRQTQWHLWFSIILMIYSVLKAEEQLLHSMMSFIRTKGHLFAEKVPWHTLSLFQQFSHCLPFSCSFLLSYYY